MLVRILSEPMLRVAMLVRSWPWLVSGCLAFACGGDLKEPSGVGNACVPSDEYSSTFSGCALGDVTLDSGSGLCESRLCLVNHFQGRVSCPYGQTSDEAFLGQGAAGSRRARSQIESSRG